MKTEPLISYIKKAWGLGEKYILVAFQYLRKSWKSAVIICPLFLFLYYFIGSIFVNNIDKNLQFQSQKQEKGYTFVATAADLIKREIDDYMFTPNLPFIFPASVLDNMPAFQKGIFQSLAFLMHFVSPDIPSKEFQKADALLQYPSNVWLFSKTKDFKLEPSSPAQYRKARRFLIKFNENTNKDAKVLQMLLSGIKQDLTQIEYLLQKAIEDEKQSRADDVFYLIQGRLYVDYLLLRAVRTDMVFDCSEALMFLEKALEIEPLVVQNGKIGNSFRPNHLLELAYYILKSNLAINPQEGSEENAD